MVHIPSVIDVGTHAPGQMLDLLRAVGPVAPVPRSAAIDDGQGRHAPRRDSAPEEVAAFADAVDGADLQAAVEEINIFLLGVPTHLEFRVEDQADRLIVSVVDSESGEVLRQLPPDEVLAISQRVRESNFGLLDSLA